jgi:ParE toxin of type II toxin-antitoxin system, parDE
MERYVVEFTSLSNQELVDAVEYYENRLPGLSEKLETELENIIQKITLNPFLFPNKFKKYREVPLKKFPFVVIYEIVGNAVVIVSVFHCKRNPDSKTKKK